MQEQSRPGTWIWSALAVLAVAAMLVAPALWNGYPLIYYDTEDYVQISFKFEPIIWRIMTYGVFCTIGRLFDTLWAVVFVQALMMSWVLHEAVAAFVPRWRLAVFLGSGVVLTAATGLPWVTSLVLADVFAGLAILGVCVLAFGDMLSRRRRLVLVPLVVISICVHMSHVAVSAGLVLVLAALWAGSWLVKQLPRPRMAVPVLAVALGTLAVPVTHWLATGRFFFSESGHVLQLALFVQNGVAKKYLDEVCPKGATFKMCAHKDELPETADEFLWGDSPFDDMGGWKAMHDEADAIVAGAIKEFPVEVGVAALANTWEQINSVETGEDLVPMTWHFVSTQLQRYPKEFRHFRFARQQRRQGLDFEPLNAYQIPVAQAAQIALILAIGVAWRRREKAVLGLSVAVLLAILGNAVVCGAISNPHDRYQNRVVWLALFVSVIGAARIDQDLAGNRRPTQSATDGGSTPISQDKA